MNVDFHYNKKIDGILIRTKKGAAVLSDTLAAGLEQYQIGPKIRALRLDKGLGQTQLGKHTGLSPALLSKIERGQIFPTLPTLLRIALVFGVGLDHFFAEERKRPLVAVTRKKDRLRMPAQPGQQQPCYFFESLDYRVTDRKMEAYYAEFPASSKASPPHHHAGAELIYVVRGQLVVDVDGEAITLDAGDALHFDSSAPHSYGSRGRTDAAALVVVVP